MSEAKGMAEEAEKIEEQPGFWSSAGSWFARYWMYLAGGVVAAGAGYAAYRYLSTEEEAE